MIFKLCFVTDTFAVIFCGNCYVYKETVFFGNGLTLFQNALLLAKRFTEHTSAVLQLPRPSKLSVLWKGGHVWVSISSNDAPRFVIRHVLVLMMSIKEILFIESIYI